MYKADYHLHSSHSMDCEMPLDTLCEKAIEAGLDEICLTEHIEFGHPAAETDIPPHIPSWLEAVERARKRFPALMIRTGIEIGDNPNCRDSIKAWLDEIPLDFRLLSLHLIDNEDPYFPEFFENRDQNQFYRRYVESKLESIMAWDASEYDSMAHLGYCAKFAKYPLPERPLRYRHAPEAFDALFRKIAQDGRALEINTSGHSTMNEFLPDRELITRFHECGGEFVTTGSDAHRPEHVGNWIEEAMALAKDCGIRYMLTFEQRKPIPKPL